MQKVDASLQALMARAKAIAEDPEKQAESERWSEERRQESERWQRERAEQRRMEALEGSPLPEADVQLLARDELRDTKSLSAVRQWAERKSPPVLILCGSVGRGKTIAGAWLIAEHGGRYEGARALQRLFRADFGEQLEEQDRVMRCGTLVLDDLGREDDAARMCSVLLDLVDWRRRRLHRTLLISNLSRKGFVERYSDPRLLSRLRECAAWVQDAGEDMRGSRG